MKRLKLVLILIGVVAICIGLSVYFCAEPTKSWQISYSQVYSSSDFVDSYETKIHTINLGNDTNHVFRLRTHFDEPLSINWIVYDPEGIEISVYDLVQYNPPAEPEFANLRVIEGKFNSTISGTYELILEEKIGQEYLADFEVSKLRLAYWGFYPHDFNPSPIIVFPIILAGIIALLIAFRIRDSNDVTLSS